MAVGGGPSEGTKTLHELYLDLGKQATPVIAVIDLEDGTLGSVMTIQTFGDYAKLHPYIHSITSDGLFRVEVVKSQ